MDPLFNLYGNPDEGIATTPILTDEDIQAVKQADLADLKEKISTTEIISPRDEPDSDLYIFCDSKIKKVLHDFLNGTTIEDRKVRKLMHENGDEFKYRALKYLYDSTSIELLRIIEDNQLDQTQFVNCLGMVHHYEMPTQEELNPTIPESAPKKFNLVQTIKDNPLLTAAGVLGLYVFFSKK